MLRKYDAMMSGSDELCGASDPLLSVVIPVRNEAGNIGPLIDEIRQAFNGHAHEILVIDDASTDSSVAEAQDRGQRPGSHLRVLQLQTPCGQSTAIRLGTEHATAALVATLDGDGQNDPADLPDLLRAFRDCQPNKSGLVQGVRQHRQDTLIRRFSSRIANAVRGQILGDNFPDSGCGIKMFSRDAALRLPYFDHMHRFMPALFRIHGYEVTAVPVRHRPRRLGMSKYGLFDRLWVGIVDLFGVAWLRRRYRWPDAVLASDEDNHDYADFLAGAGTGRSGAVQRPLSGAMDRQ